MKQIFNYIDIIILTKNQEIVLIKRKTNPHINQLALIGAVQDSFESFPNAIEKTLKKKLGIYSKIEKNQILLKNIGTFKLNQFNSYDSGTDTRGGNTTIFSIQTNLNKEELKIKIPQNTYIYDKNNIPKLAFEHNKFLEEFFFKKQNYTIAKTNQIKIAVDIVIFTINQSILKILLPKRIKEPYKSHYSLPGGFIENQISLNESAKNILKRDTNLQNVFLEQLYTFGDIKRDNRGQIISVSYYALIDSQKQNLIHSQKYDTINWFNLNDLKKIKIAFDHKQIIDLAIQRIKNKIEYSNIAFQLLPEKFTLAELQEVYEAILEKKIDKRNFRKKIKELDMLEELNEFKKQGRMRPAKYHRFKERTKETIFKPKRWI